MTYVMRGAGRDVETPPALTESDARRYAQQWADETGTPIILFRDDNGRLRHVDNIQPNPHADIDPLRDRIYDTLLAALNEHNVIHCPATGTGPSNGIQAADVEEIAEKVARVVRELTQ